MKLRRVVFAPEAEDDLLELYRYISLHAESATAARYVEAVIRHCERLVQFPNRGARRDDIRPGLRVTHYRRKTVIAFTIEADRLVILGVFHRGREYAARLSPEA